MSRRQTAWSQAANPWPRLAAKRVDAGREAVSLAHWRAARDLRALARDARQIGLELGRNGICEAAELLEAAAARLLPPDERGGAA